MPKGTVRVSVYMESTRRKPALVKRMLNTIAWGMCAVCLLHTFGMMSPVPSAMSQFEDGSFDSGSFTSGNYTSEDNTTAEPPPLALSRYALIGPQEQPPRSVLSPPFLQGSPPVCHLDENKPLPVVLMTFCRSGSSSLWQVVSKLSGSAMEDDDYVHFFVGKEPKTSAEISKFFRTIPPGDNGNWLLKVMCEKQNAHPKVGIVGMKWKPLHLHSPPSVDALRLIAHSARPQIKVVRSRRNPLDVFISNLKHNRASRQIQNACKVNQTDCIRLHKELSTGMILPLTNLLDWLRRHVKYEDAADSLLHELRVPHVKVSYEKLFMSNNVEEWMRIFWFLGVGPSSALTLPQIEQVMMYGQTSNLSHNITLGNYNEVKALLEGTEFETYLR